MEQKTLISNKETLAINQLVTTRWSTTKLFFILNFCWSLLVTTTLIGLTLFVFIKQANVIQANNSFTNFVLMMVALGLLIVIYLFLMMMNLCSVRYSMIHFKEKIFYALISLNLVRLIIIVNQAWKLGLVHFKLQRWTILDIALMGLTIALFFTFKAIEAVVPPIPPLYISLSLSYFAFFLVSFLTGSFLKTFFVCFISGLFLMAFPTTYFKSFLQYLFDYLIPVCAFSLTFFINFNRQEQKTVQQRLQWIVFIIAPFIVVLFFRIIAGVLFYGNDSWSGVSVWLFSTVINLVNTTFDLVVCLLLVPPILSKLWFLKEKYQQQINH